jgi:iron-sulfur cluster repair protein YtfE (RIC family)
MDQHLMKEERILFPTIVEIELCVIEGTEPQIMACGVMGPVNQAVYEHNQIREILNAIVRDCPHTGREDLNEAVVALREHVLDHIHIEEDELFPLAEELCPGITV